MLKVMLRQIFYFFLILGSPFVACLNGSQSRIRTFNGWKAIEVITEGDSTESGGWEVPEQFDGAGAFLVDSTTIRIHLNHEIRGSASISEIDLNKERLKRAISNMIRNNDIGNNEFVISARLAYDRWSTNGGASFRTNVNPADTRFCKFCSSQEYKPNTFGNNRGFVDQLYITGEECDNGKLYVLDSHHKTLYRLSGFTGSSSNSNGGMPFDPWENAALIDTGETNHIVLLLSPDGDGSAKYLRIYIGKKGKNPFGTNDDDFLSRNGLAYGEWYYMRANFPATSETNNGSFQKGISGALRGGKLEDVDTNPNNPTQVVLAEQNRGLYIFDFDLEFNDEGFDFAASSFSVTKIQSGSIDNTDNVEWSENGKIFVNEDSDRGAVWYTAPDGSTRTKIGETTVDAESSGIFDFSVFVDYTPGSIIVTTNQGNPSSMTILINPRASLLSVSSDEQNNFLVTETETNPNSPATRIIDTADIYQAEDATMVLARIERRFSGYSGDSYVDMIAQGASLEWLVTVLDDGEYELSISYASPTTRTVELHVDGSQKGSFAFEQTSGWSDWNIESKIVSLFAGTHIIKVSAVQSSGPNIDWLKVRYFQALLPPAPLVPSDGPIRYEAEDGSCGVCEMTGNHEGYSGNGYIDFLGNHAYVQWIIEVPTSNTFEVSIRYAARTERPSDFLVDDEKRVELLFDSTGSWTSWETETFLISLVGGSHVIRIDCGEKSIGPNVDWLSMKAIEQTRRTNTEDESIKYAQQNRLEAPTLRGRLSGRETP